MLTRLTALVLLALVAFAAGGCSPATKVWTIETDRACTVVLNTKEDGNRFCYGRVALAPGRNAVAISYTRSSALMSVVFPKLERAGTAERSGSMPDGEPQPPIDSDRWDIAFTAATDDFKSWGVARARQSEPGVVRLAWGPLESRVDAIRVLGRVEAAENEEEVVALWGEPLHRASVDGVTVASWSWSTIYFRNGRIVGSAR